VLNKDWTPIQHMIIILGSIVNIVGLGGGPI